MGAVSYLACAAYALGEQRRVILELPEVEARLAAHGAPFLPEVLGLGAYHVASNPFSLASSALERTLALAQLEPRSLSCVIVSSSSIPAEFAPLNKELGHVYARHGVQPSTTFAVSGTGCVALLSAVDLAGALLDARGYETVLVVHVEAWPEPDDAARLLGYAMLSDAAATLLVSRRPWLESSYEISASVTRADASQMTQGLRWDSPDLGASVVAEALSRATVEQSSIARVFANNTFLPVKKNRERSLGFTQKQLYLDNTRRTGHCLAADPIVNLVDFAERAPLSAPCLLYGEADGHAGALVLTAPRP